MIIYSDEKIYEENPQTMELEYRCLYRPTIPMTRTSTALSISDEVEISIVKNDTPLFNLFYTVKKDIVEGNSLYCMSSFLYEEIENIKDVLPVEVVDYKDARIFKDEGYGQVYSRVLRPRNILRNGIGPFVVNDDIRIVIKINNIEQYHFKYVVKFAPTDGMKLVLNLHIDFVES